MPAYAFAHLHDPHLNAEVIEYIKRIQATLEPYGGRFVIHGGAIEVLEGSWQGDMVMIAFPSGADARAWYHSPVYQELIPLRADHIKGDILIVEGVDEDYDAAAKIRTLEAQAGAAG
ncbi:DUF1330 domain-containing protein [Streptomyces sp. NPDC089919]|uniref:DUF1330 domain-containing protein n=1 Tax=Streptomyces sp. NPDC089919 TaxID=3155188 RepID=UPI00341C6682